MAYTDIDKPTDYFNTVLRSGLYGGSDTAFTVGFQPDWIWDKRRSGTSVHALFDSVRGFGSSGKVLYSNTNDAEATNGLIDSVNSTGFTIKASSDNTGTLVDWCWKKSTVAGFDICSWTGNGSAQNISHNLSKVPTMIIVKNRTDAGADWYCYNVHNGNTHSMILNTNGAKVGAYSDNWNNTTPTSSVFTVGSSNSTGGSSGDNMIAYVFTDIQGYSKFGSYTGNGNASGPMIFTGFKPAWILIKVTSTSNDWILLDNKRDTFNVATKKLLANESNAESSDSGVSTDFLSNGFKFRTAGNNVNVSGGTYIYMAFAESPFVNSSGVPNNAK